MDDEEKEKVKQLEQEYECLPQCSEKSLFKSF